MPSLVKRENVWYTRWWDNGKERWKALSPNKLAAQVKIIELEKSIRSRRYGDPLEEKEINWVEFVEKYMAYCKANMAQATYVRHEVVFSNFQKAITIQKLSELTPELVEEFKTIRNNAGKLPGTINREVTVLRSAACLAKQWGYATSNLAVVRKIPEVKKRPVFFTEPEIAAMLQRADPFWRTVVYLGFYAGLRMGEMLHLNWQDVDFEDHQLRITPREDWHPKDYEAREIDLHPALKDHLKAWKAVCQSGVRVLPWERKTNQMSNMFSNFLRRCGIAKGSLHTLRHSFASHLAMADVNLLKIAKLMGHNSVKTTQIYAHLQTSSLKEAVHRLPAISTPQDSNSPS